MTDTIPTILCCNENTTLKKEDMVSCCYIQAPKETDKYRVHQDSGHTIVTFYNAEKQPISSLTVQGTDVRGKRSIKKKIIDAAGWCGGEKRYVVHCQSPDTLELANRGDKPILFYTDDGESVTLYPHIVLQQSKDKGFYGTVSFANKESKRKIAGKYVYLGEGPQVLSRVQFSAEGIDKKNESSPIGIVLDNIEEDTTVDMRQYVQIEENFAEMGWPPSAELKRPLALHSKTGVTYVSARQVMDKKGRRETVLSLGASETVDVQIDVELTSASDIDSLFVGNHSLIVSAFHLECGPLREGQSYLFLQQYGDYEAGHLNDKQYRYVEYYVRPNFSFDKQITSIYLENKLGNTIYLNPASDSYEVVSNGLPAEIVMSSVEYKQGKENVYDVSIKGFDLEKHKLTLNKPSGGAIIALSKKGWDTSLSIRYDNEVYNIIIDSPESEPHKMLEQAKNGKYPALLKKIEKDNPGLYFESVIIEDQFFSVPPESKEREISKPGAAIAGLDIDGAESGLEDLRLASEVYRLPVMAGSETAVRQK